VETDNPSEFELAFLLEDIRFSHNGQRIMINISIIITIIINQQIGTYISQFGILPAIAAVI
jgi:hypothetical protein